MKDSAKVLFEYATSDVLISECHYYRNTVLIFHVTFLVLQLIIIFLSFLFWGAFSIIGLQLSISGSYHVM